MIMVKASDMPDTAGGVPVRPWHSAAPDYEIDYLPDGPALLYVHQERTTDTRTVTQVDHSAVMSSGLGSNEGRERALCRALLLHALHLLDEAEKGS